MVIPLLVWTTDAGHNLFTYDSSYRGNHEEDESSLKEKMFLEFRSKIVPCRMLSRYAGSR